MAEITNEVIYREILALSEGLEKVERGMKVVSVELNRTLWELEYGRQRIDRSRRVYEEQVARRRNAL